MSLPEKIILGTVQLGLSYGISNSSGQPSREEAFSILQTAASKGIALLDTAEAYGNSQQVIGEYQRSHPPFRIISKFRSAETPESLRERLENSLRDLNVPKLYAYYFHSFGEYASHPHLKQALIRLKQEGLIQKTGVSVYTPEELLHAANDEAIEVIQFPFNCLDNYRRWQKEIALARANGKELHVRSVFLQGLFFREPESLNGKLELLKNSLVRLRGIAADCHYTMADLAFAYAFALTQPKENAWVDYLVIGVETRSQLMDNLQLETNLPDGIWNEITNIEVADPKLLNPGNWK